MTNNTDTNIMIRKVECLSCKYLCSENKKTYPCINSNLCPAKHYQIIIGLNIDKVARILAKALADHDTDKIASITQKLSCYSQVVQDEVLKKAKTLS